MATITQAIATLEQQLSELAHDDGAKCFEHVYAYAVTFGDMETPCAVILADTTTRVRVTAYRYAYDREQVEKDILAIAEVCIARWNIRGRFGWESHLGSVYRTFSFSLTCG